MDQNLLEKFKITPLYTFNKTANLKHVRESSPIQIIASEHVFT